MSGINETQEQSFKPPKGWYPLGTFEDWTEKGHHYNYSKSPLEFSGRGYDGETLWERPVSNSERYHELVNEHKCPYVSLETGDTCKKALFLANNNEYWDHAGGHYYISTSFSKIMSDDKMHIDATALLSGQPATYHHENDCDYTGFCEWRKY